MDYQTQNRADTDTFFTISNLLSLLRIPIAIVIIYLHYSNGRQITPGVILFFVLGIASDYADGILARKLKQISEVGKALDPVCDKIAAGMLFIYVVWLGHIPLWFLVVVAVRDLTIATGSLWVKRKTGTMPMALYSGKVSLNVLVFYWIVALAFPHLQALVQISMAASLLLMVYSLFAYVCRFYNIAQGTDFT